MRVEHIGANAGGFVHMRWMIMDVHCKFSKMRIQGHLLRVSKEEKIFEV